MLFSSMILRRALFPRTSSLTRKVPVQASIARSVRHTHAPGREIKNIYPPLAAYPGKMDTRKTPNVVIIGCSYAGMSAAMTLIALKDGLQIPFASYGDYSHLRNFPSSPDFNITMIDERDGFFHSVGAPLAHVSPAQTSAMWKLYKGFSKLDRFDINFIQGRVSDMEFQSQEISYCDPAGEFRKLSYDYAVISTGLARQWPILPRAKDLLSYEQDAWSYTGNISRAKKLGVVVVGGGAVGIEYAGKIKLQYPQTPVTLVHSRHQLLSNEPLPDEFKEKTLQILQDQGIRVLLGKRCTVEDLVDGNFYAKFDDGNRIHAGMVIMATSKSYPATKFVPESALNQNGSINVDKQLRVSGPCSGNQIFAAGDIVNSPLMKLGGNAMLMGSVAAANIFSVLQSSNDPSRPPTLESCPTIEPKMGLSVGHNAIVYSGPDGDISFGEDLGQSHFGSDLGWTRVLSALGLDDAAKL